MTSKSRMLLGAGERGISGTDAISVSAGMKYPAFRGNHAVPSRVSAGLAAAEVLDSTFFASDSSSRIHSFPFLPVV